MALDALRGYLQLAGGLTEVTRRRAVQEAKALLALRPDLDGLIPEKTKGRASDVSGQVQALADELMATSKANRDLLTAFVRAEVERGVAGLRLVRADELDALRARVARLEATVPGATAPARKAGAKSTATKKAAAKKPAVKKPAVKKTAAKKTVAGKATNPTRKPT